MSQENLIKTLFYNPLWMLARSIHSLRSWTKELSSKMI